MVSQTNEAALETHIENALARDGYRVGNPADFDREFAVDGRLFWEFLEATQPKELAKLSGRPNWRRLVLERLNKKIKKDSVVGVLKRGLDIDDAHFDLLYRLPYNDLNPEVRANFARNIFSVSRQVHFSASNALTSVDMVLFVNGLAVATLELKNPWTGQTAWNAIYKQYNIRDPKEPLFEFGRCLVHFAVDPDEAYMCTQLAGKDSNFLPFNKGNQYGRGNPVNPNGHKTAYLWENVLARESLTNIVEQFAKLTVEKDRKTGKERRTLVFPRYQQLDVVRGILADARQNGVGQTYLIQHSAGSGKSNSITWLAYQLVELYDTAGTANVFDSVVVVTDRRGAGHPDQGQHQAVFRDEEHCGALRERAGAEIQPGGGQETHYHHGAEVSIHRRRYRAAVGPQFCGDYRRGAFVAIRYRRRQGERNPGRAGRG